MMKEELNNLHATLLENWMHIEERSRELTELRTKLIETKNDLLGYRAHLMQLLTIPIVMEKSCSLMDGMNASNCVTDSNTVPRRERGDGKMSRTVTSAGVNNILLLFSDSHGSDVAKQRNLAISK